MLTAEQLLSGASIISDTGSTEVIEVDKKLYIDFDTRQILIPDCIHQLGVESDDDVKKLTFSVPKMYYDCDLSTFNIYINYMNAKKEGDLFKVLPEKVREVGDNLEFDWIVGRNAVAYKGTVIFNVCMKKGSMQPDEEDPSQEIFVVDQEFNTTVANLPVLEGLETGEEVAQEYADFIMQWEEMLFGIENSAKQNIILKGAEVIDAVEAAGEAQRQAIIQKGSEVVQTIDTRKTEIGTAATQALSDISTAKNEVISESEAQIQAIILKGSEVVQTVNTAGENQINAIETKGTEVVNTVGEQLDIKIPAYIEANPDQFKGEKGDPGEKGEPGVNGYTPQKGVDYFDGEKGDKGDPGADGYTPQKGVDYFDGNNGADGVDGQDGQDGISPTVEIKKVGKVTTITITDASGTHTATINDGTDGNGSGDMSRATYDTDGDGIVDDSDKLGGVAASEYALKTDIPETPTISITDDGNGNISLSFKQE